MLTAIIGFFFGLAVATSAQESRRPQSPVSKHVALAIAIVLTLLFFGYTLGKDFAKRDNQATGCLVLPQALAPA